MKKNKIFRKAMSLLLTLTILVGTVSIGIPFMKLNVRAAGTITTSDGTKETITQTMVVSPNDIAKRNETYASYGYDFHKCSEPTNIVVPGLDPNEDYVIQGMAYYAKEDWILVTAYHNDETYSSKVFCIDAVSGEFVAMLSFLNEDGSVNKDHGGGIAISENNLYYSCGDKDRSIAYAPLSALDGIKKGEHRVVQLVDEVEFYEVGSISDGDATAYTAYVCYDQGVLWMGNFYDPGALGSNVAADYKIAANSAYNSMIWGYRLSGSTSEEEWTNLTSGSENCQGTPSYAIGIPSDLSFTDITGDTVKVKDIQYAAVHDGKLYLSSSYGSGTGNSLTFGFHRWSYLRIADIDLSLPGNKSVDIRYDGTNTKTISGVYEITDFTQISLPPMMEGLCIIDDYVYTTFESASNKYLNESGGVLSIGNCIAPIDVVWKVDQYAALGVERPVEDEKTICYEEVTSQSFSADEEYLIVYESTLKDPVTQEKYLYALDPNVSYDGYRLTKNSTGGDRGYNGMYGHEIRDYDIVNGILYLNDLEKDDNPNLRWKIDASGYISSNSTYFSTYPHLKLSNNTVSMSQNANVQVSLVGAGDRVRDGKFYIYSGDNYLWCNDGSNANYNTKIDAWYDANASTSVYADATATPGMMYPNALGATNIISGAVADYGYGQFRIFKRVIDEYSSTAESRVYTDMNAELQSDGTYTVTLETYATGTTQNVKVAERPTDYIFVLDTSASMTNNTDCSGYQRYYDNVQPYTVAGDTNDIGDKNASTMSGGNMFVRHNGEFCPLTVEGSERGDAGSWYNHKYYKNYWLSFVCQGTTYWWVPNSTTDPKQGGAWSTTKPAQNATMYVQANSDDSRAKAVIYYGEHFRYNETTGTTRLGSMQTAMYYLINKIGDNASATGLDHRIALVQFGSDGAENWINTGMYTNDETSMVQYSGDTSIAADTYGKAFYDAANFETVCDIVWSLNTNAGDSDTYVNYGFDMANGIINNSGNNYLSDGERAVSVILITDGVPGVGGDDANTARTAANLAIAEAHEAKMNGAAVYSVAMADESMTNFTMQLYLEYVSSLYPDAQSMHNYGNKNNNGVAYKMYIPAGTTNMYNVMVDTLFASVQNDTTNGLAHMDENSVLKEQLSLAFRLPSKDIDGYDWSQATDCEIQLVPGLYDAIGRMSFYEDQAYDAKTVTVTPSTAADGSVLFAVSGFDYSDNYVAKGSTNGHKLRITLKGVLANQDADITNTSINNDTVTAIYHKNHLVKKFPTEYFNIPTYTYVLDYDLPMYDSDINGKLLSVDGGLNKQSTYKDSRETENIALNFKNNNLDMTYELISGAYTEEDNRSYCLIKRDDGTYDWFRINIVPASNVLFEENRFTASSVGSLTKSNWKTDGTVLETYQTLSGDNDRYGYDVNYANNGAGYSNGTALKATVNSSTKRSETMTFSYIGTGFDLMAVCGANTGIQMVNVKRADGSIEKVYMVDTYYVDTANYDGALLKQVPIVNHTNSEYGEYTVEVTAAYLSNAQGVTGGRTGKLNKAYTAQDLLKDMGIPANKVEYVWFNNNSVLNGGTGPAAKATSETRGTSTASNVSLDCYIDGIRVYNPLGGDTSKYIDSEKGAKYYNIVNELASGKGDVITSESGLFAYIVGALGADEDGNIPTLSFGNYQSVGPQNEIYLQSATGNSDSHAVAFNVKVPNADSRVMISLRAVDGATTAKVASGDSAIEFAINTATEQYFDITPYLDIDTSTGMANVVITNSGTGLLSVNNLKLVDAIAQAVTSEDLPAMAMSFSLRARTVDPNSYDYDGVSDEIITDDTQQPEVDTPADDNTDVETPVVENIFTRIIAFFKKLFETIFRI